MTSAKWMGTKYPGVWYREHTTRKIKNNTMKDRYYCICYRYVGKVKWEAIGWQSQGATIENAVKILATVKSAIREGAKFKSLKEKRSEMESEKIRQEQNSWTLKDYWIKMYCPKIKPVYKESSMKRVNGIFNKWILKMFGNIDVSNISRQHWDSLRDALTEASLSIRSKEYIIGEMRRLLNDAKEHGLNVQKIPSGRQIGITAPKNNRRERVITPKEGALILEQLRKHDINAFNITKFAFLTGCRFSECANLRWEYCRGDFILLMDTKNKTNRKIMMSSEISALFGSLSTKSDMGYVFLNSKSEPYKQPPKSFGNATEYLKLNENRGKLDRITFHSIRHSVATKLAECLDIRSLMDFMGWKRIEMAARYINGNEDKMKNAAETLKELFIV